MSVFIIAEAGVNHNGDLNKAKSLIDVAVQAGADAVKFQTFKTELLVTANAPRAVYQKTGSDDSQFTMLKALELSADAHFSLAEYAKSQDIEFMSTAFDSQSLDFLITLGIQRIKIPSGEITNLPLLKTIASKKLPMILSTGMSDLAEVREALAVIGTATLLHCTSNYPTVFEDVNLRAMETLAQHFNLPVGYSDHTLGVSVAPLAVAMGATVIEKHFTLDKALPGPDHQASLDPAELKQMVVAIRQAERILGCGEKQACASELPIRDVTRRSIIIMNNKQAGEVILADDLKILRPGTGIAPKYLEKIIGTTVKRPLLAGTPLQWEDVSESLETTPA